MTVRVQHDTPQSTSLFDQQFESLTTDSLISYATLIGSMKADVGDPIASMTLTQDGRGIADGESPIANPGSVFSATFATRRGAVTTATTTAEVVGITPSVIASMAFHEVGDVWEPETNIPSQGNWVWGRFASGTTGIAANGSGGFNTTPQTTGTVPVGANGAELDIPEGGTAGTAYTLAIYQRISGVDSNVLQTEYTADG